MTTTTTTTTLYRALLREAQYPTKLIPHFRSLAETHDELLLQNAIYFLRAQRLHTVLYFSLLLPVLIFFFIAFVESLQSLIRPLSPGPCRSYGAQSWSQYAQDFPGAVNSRSQTCHSSFFFFILAFVFLTPSCPSPLLDSLPKS